MQSSFDQNISVNVLTLRNFLPKMKLEAVFQNARSFLDVPIMDKRRAVVPLLQKLAVHLVLLCYLLQQLATFFSFKNTQESYS